MYVEMIMYEQYAKMIKNVNCQGKTVTEINETVRYKQIKDQRGSRDEGWRGYYRRPEQIRQRPITGAGRISKSYRKGRGDRQCAHEERYLREGRQSSSFNDRPKSFQTPRKFDRRKRNDIRQILGGIDMRYTSEAALILGVKVEPLKEFLKSATTENLNRAVRCLNNLDLAFKSKMTPALLSNIVSVIKETEFMHKSIGKLKSYFETEHSLEKGAYHLDTVCAIIRIVIRICTLTPSAITFIYGCQEDISELLDLLRCLIEDTQRKSSTKTISLSSEKISESSENENKIERKGPDLVGCMGEDSNNLSDISAFDDIISNSVQYSISENNIERKGADLIESVDNDNNKLSDISACDNSQKHSVQNYIGENQIERKGADLVGCIGDDGKKLSDMNALDDNKHNSVQDSLSENKIEMKCSGIGGCIEDFSRNFSSITDLHDIPSSSDQDSISKNTNDKKGPDFDRCCYGYSNKIEISDHDDNQSKSIQNFMSENKVEIKVFDLDTNGDNLSDIVKDMNNSHSMSEKLEMLDSSLHFEKIKTDFKCIEQLFEELLDVVKISAVQNSKHTKHKQRDYKKESDENFREIPIFPRIGDLNGDIQPNLKVNKAKGEYSSVDDYLDVQFRLLREDFIEPLRAGILEFKGKKTYKSTKKNQDIKVYENTHIISPFCGNGVNHIISFDIGKLRHIRWNMSKRLKYGSLVCLTANNFETCFFASIVDSDSKFRRQGRVHVKFVQSPEQEKFLRGETFTMVESAAYFEAYRPVLSSLQAIEERDLPFKKYLIKCENEVSLPKYLLRKSSQQKMDLQCLLRPKYGFGEREDYFPDLKPVNVKILEKDWQIEDKISLDSSQMCALKSALTREFTLIQGPPGCGKTHVGLIISKVLLFNKRNWKHADGSPAQMLVVCYTNHALDQFLEGIRSFHRGKIVRVGGRSSNENLDDLNLKHIKQVYRKDKRFPQSIGRGRSYALSDVIPLRQIINLESEKIKLLKGNIVHENALYSFMTTNHRKQFERFSRYCRFSLPPWLEFLGDSCIVDWLGITAITKRVQECTYKERQNIRDIEFEEMIDELCSDENRKALIEIDFDNTNLLENNEKRELEDFKKNELSLDLDKVGCSSLAYLSDRKRARVAYERKILIKYIKCKLQRIKPMSKSEAIYVGDIMNKDFSDDKRWALYLSWVQNKCYKMHKALKKQLNHYETADRRLKEVEMMEDLFILRTADIIGMTITGAAMHKTVLTEIKPTIMIVEEAAEVLESHLISNLTSGCEQLVMIGDHKQLKPKPNVFRLERDYNMALSLFERMVRNGLRCDCLRIQHRMRPEIADNVRIFYESLEDHESVKHYESMKGLAHNVYFIDHCSEEKKDQELKSFTNDHEANFLIALCRYLLLQGYNASNITILTTYSGQRFLMKKKMLEQGEALKDVRLTVVDNYQGEENDIILLSLVRSNKEGKIGYVAKDNRICVALSRAKKGLFISGNRNCLQSSNSKWKSIIEKMYENGFVGEALHLRCQNHPNDDGIMAKCSEDFKGSPEGGCGKMCEIRLQCGHCCGKRCHIVNQEHLDVVCRKQCVKKCKNGHQCQKQCFEECYCEEIIIVTLPCGHITQVKCLTDIESYVCERSCNKRLNCGHVCQRKCQDDCICMEPINVKLKCGHDATIPCSVKPSKHKCDAQIKVLLPHCGHFETVFCRDSGKSVRCNNICGLPLDCGHLCRGICGDTTFNIPDDAYSKCQKGHNTKCISPCMAILKCGHPCKGTCYSCYQGRWHKLCSVECNCLLICGHKCKGKCGFCLPCPEKCKRRCSHTLCGRKCFENCKQCTKKCTWKCKHFSCTAICGKECDRPRCNKKCEKLLKCKHRCIGMCGDPCPNLCHICDKEKMNEITYANDIKPNERYVQLQDCKHIIEYKLMDTYMDLDDGLYLKRCPKCNYGIWNTNGNRYENVVNKAFLRINDVRQITLRDFKLHEILMASASKQSAEIIDGIEISIPITRPVASSNFDLSTYFNKSHVAWSDLFTFLACRDDVNVLNHLSILKFIKSVAKQNSYWLDDELLFEGASLCFFSQQHIYEVEREVKRYLDKCQFKSLHSQENVNTEFEESFENAFKVLMQKGEYSEESRKKVQRYMNQLPERNTVERKLIDLSFTEVDIDRDTILRNRYIDIGFRQEAVTGVYEKSIGEKNDAIDTEIRIQVQGNNKEPQTDGSNFSDHPVEHQKFKIYNQSTDQKGNIESNQLQILNVELEDGEIFENKIPNVISRQLHFGNDRDLQQSELTTLKDAGYRLEDTEVGETIEECETDVHDEGSICRKMETVLQKSTMMTFPDNDNNFLSEEEAYQKSNKQNTKCRDVSECQTKKKCNDGSLPKNYLDGMTYRVELFRWRGIPYFHNKRSVLNIQQIKEAQAMQCKEKDTTLHERRASSLSNKRKQISVLKDEVGPTNKKFRKDGKLNFKIKTKSKLQAIDSNPLEEFRFDIDGNINTSDRPTVATKTISIQDVKVGKTQDQTKVQTPKDVFKQDNAQQRPSESDRRLVEYDDFEIDDELECESSFGLTFKYESKIPKIGNRRYVHFDKECDVDILSKRKGFINAGQSTDDNLKQNRGGLMQQIGVNSEKTKHATFSEDHFPNQISHDANMISNIILPSVGENESPSDLRILLNKTKRRNVNLKGTTDYSKNRNDLRNRLKTIHARSVSRKFKTTNRKETKKNVSGRQINNLRGRNTQLSSLMKCKRKGNTHYGRKEQEQQSCKTNIEIKGDVYQVLDQV